MEKVRYMISDAANIVNVESHVLRYWEDELELDIPRNEMGHRYYTKENIQEFQRIKELKEQGYQLKAIRMIVHNGPLDGLTQEPPVGQAKLAGGESVTAAKSDAGQGAGTAKAVSGQVPGIPTGKLQETAAEEQETAAKGEDAKRQAQEKSSAGQGQSRMLGRQAAGLKQGGNTEKITPLKEPGNPIYLATIQEPARQMTPGDIYAAGKQLSASETAEQTTGLQIASAGEIQLQESRQSILDNTDKMAQFTDLMTQIVGQALAANNQALSQSISEDVGKQVIKEMNYLMREREELDEDRFRKLDAAIRGNLRKKEEDKGFFKKKKK